MAFLSRLFDKRLRPGRSYAARGEERVLNGLLEDLGSLPRWYVDIGASDGLKLSNTAALALQGWTGTCFEYDPAKVARFAGAYRDQPQVSICRAKITPTNVTPFLEAFGVRSDFGVLSLDIDSYDYFVLEALLEKYRPAVVITEINEKVPPPLLFTVLFDESQGWDGSHFYGQSICSLAGLAGAHDYALAALEYNNAFLVDRRRYGHPGLSAREAWEQGYLRRTDRRSEFPWNRDMEDLLTMSPEAAQAALDRRFAAYSGRYRLAVAPELA